MEEIKELSKAALYYQSKKKENTNLCVYQQLDENDIVFYVGIGSLCQALSPFYKGRAWIKKAKQGYYTKIVQRGLDKSSAMKLMSKLQNEIGFIEDSGTLIKPTLINDVKRAKLPSEIDPLIIKSIQDKLKETDYSSYKMTRKLFYKEFLKYDVSDGFNIKKFAKDINISLPPALKYIDEVFNICGLTRK